MYKVDKKVETSNLASRCLPLGTLFLVCFPGADLHFCSRYLSLQTVIYLDDILLVAFHNNKLQDYLNSTLPLQDLLGFTHRLNIRKSVLNPVQEIEFLGFLLNSRAGHYRLISRMELLTRFLPGDACKTGIFGHLICLATIN